MAAGLDEKDDKVQVSTLVYAMGGNANDILKSFHLAERDTVYATVKRRFETHFVGRSNVIFERARFNRRVQGDNEPVVEFIESIYELAETCQFGPLKEELIRDRIVVGIRNAALSQKLMQDEKLTLKKAVKEAKSSALVKQHHKMLTADGGEISSVRSKKKKPPKNKNKPWEKPSNSNSERSKNGRNAKHPSNCCYRCGKSPPHKREECPESEATCLKCKKIGHYASKCRTTNVRSTEEDSEISGSDDYFLGSIESDEKQSSLLS